MMESSFPQKTTEDVTELADGGDSPEKTEPENHCVPQLNFSFDDQHDKATGIQYENYPEVHYAELHHNSLPPQVAYDYNNYPQVSYESQPEVKNDRTAPEVFSPAEDPHAIDSSAPETASRHDNQDKHRRKRRLWILGAVVTLVATLAIVLGAALGTRSAKSSPGPITGGQFMPTTELAAVNYTDSSDIMWHRVYYQATSGALYQSVWSSIDPQWKVRPLRQDNDTTGPEVKIGTPISAHVYKENDANNQIEYHVFFLDTKNGIWELWSYDPDNIWVFPNEKALQGNFTAGPNSKLTSYGRQCNTYCSSTSVVVYQDFNNDLMYNAFYNVDNWRNQAFVADKNHPVVNGSGLSIVPVWQKQPDLMALYTNTGNLTRFIFNASGSWTWMYNQTLNGAIDRSTNLAAFTMGYAGTNDSASDMEVLATAPGSKGVTNWDSDYAIYLDVDWPFNKKPAFSNVSESSKIAANHAGRIYAVEGNELFEWEWISSNRTFERVGTVDTAIGK